MSKDKILSGMVYVIGTKSNDNIKLAIGQQAEVEITMEQTKDLCSALILAMENASGTFTYSIGGKYTGEGVSGLTSMSVGSS